MLVCFCGIFLISLQAREIGSVLVIHPKDSSAYVGDYVSFPCAINSSSSGSSSEIRWIYTKDKNFLNIQNIYAFGRMFPQWKTGHNVTESPRNHFLLTISSVKKESAGFYTCIDVMDGSRATAELKVLAADVVSSAPSETTTVTDAIYNNREPFILKHKAQDNEKIFESVINEKPGSTGLSIAVVCLFVFLMATIITAIIVIFGVCLRLQRSTETYCRKVGKHPEILEARSERCSFPQNSSVRDTLEQLNEYEAVSTYEETTVLQLRRQSGPEADGGEWNSCISEVEESDILEVIKNDSAMENHAIWNRATVQTELPAYVFLSN